jgi:protein-tyrosine phosphatase
MPRDLDGGEIAGLRPELARLLAASPNFRGLGGLPAAGGRRIRGGLLYRSGALDELEEADLGVLGGLGIALCFDLRSAGERGSHPSRWPAGGEPRTLAIEVATDIRAMDGAALRAMGGGMDAAGAAAMMRAIYSSMPGSCAPVLGALFGELAALRAPDATVIHCTAGKDRTGFVVAMLLHALGVDEAAIRANYLESNHHYDAARHDARIAALLESSFGVAPGAEALQAITAARLDYLEAALETVRRGWGGVEAYLEACGGLDAARRRKLQEALLQPAGAY